MYSVNSRSVFDSGTEAQDEGEDSKTETLSVCEWGKKAERMLCSTLFPSNPRSLSIPILAVDALLSHWIGFQAWHEAHWDWGSRTDGNGIGQKYVMTPLNMQIAEGKVSFNYLNKLLASDHIMAQSLSRLSGF